MKVIAPIAPTEMRELANIALAALVMADNKTGMGTLDARFRGEDLKVTAAISRTAQGGTVFRTYQVLIPGHGSFQASVIDELTGYIPNLMYISASHHMAMTYIPVHHRVSFSMGATPVLSMHAAVRHSGDQPYTTKDGAPLEWASFMTMVSQLLAQHRAPKQQVERHLAAATMSALRAYIHEQHAWRNAIGHSGDLMFRDPAAAIAAYEELTGLTTPSLDFGDQIEVRPDYIWYLRACVDTVIRHCPVQIVKELPYGNYGRIKLRAPGSAQYAPTAVISGDTDIEIKVDTAPTRFNWLIGGGLDSLAAAMEPTTLAAHIDAVLPTFYAHSGLKISLSGNELVGMGVSDDINDSQATLLILKSHYDVDGLLSPVEDQPDDYPFDGYALYIRSAVVAPGMKEPLLCLSEMSQRRAEHFLRQAA